jgi:hypothetical protein
VRISIFIRATLLFLGIASPALLFAQFQQPTDEELKMTSDPKAPGAAAVYLNIEEIDNDPMHFQSTYARIKVLQEKGKELATVEVPYAHGDSEITDIQGRTIHADGTIVPLEGKPEDLISARLITRDDKKEQINRRVFTLPSVEVGSILEYRYTYRYNDNHYSSPFWEIQKPYFVHKAHYAFTPYKAFLPSNRGLSSSNQLVDAKGNTINSLIWWPILPQGVQIKTDVVGTYSVDIADVPPIPDEEWTPPIQSYLYKVLFYYMSASNPKEFWDSSAKSWSKDVDHFAEPSKTIREAVSGVIAPSDSDLDKAKKLYKAVQSIDNTDFSRVKGQLELKQLGLKVAKRAEDTWSQKSGSGEDIALLYLAMTRAAGLTGYAMKVVDRELGLFDASYLRFDQLQDTIVILKIDGKEVNVDPSEKMCPFGFVHWRHLGSGVRQTANGPSFTNTQLQPYTANTLVRLGIINIDDHGAIAGDFRFDMEGQEALDWRQAALRNDLDEVKKRFDRHIESIAPDGVQGHLDHFVGLDDPDAKLQAFIKVQGTLGTATSKRLLLPGFFFETRGRLPFVNQEKRLEPVDMHYADHVTDQVTFHLPAGLTVEGTPQDTKIPWPDHSVFVTKSILAPGQVTIARSLARGFVILMPNEYKDLRDFYQKVAASDQQQLVLTASQAAKGN